MSALRRFLHDFDAVPSTAPPPAPPRPAAAAAVLPLFGAEPAPGAASVEPAVDRTDEAAAVTAAVAAGVASALAEAGVAHAAALAEAAERHAAELALARERWAAEEGAALAAGFRSAVEGLGAALGDAAAAALEPLLGEAARRFAVDELRSAVADLLLAGPGGTGGAGFTVAVSGPGDLLDALRAALDTAGIGTGALEFTAGDAAEVVVTADGSRIETRLAAWAGAFGRRAAGDVVTRTTMADDPAADAGADGSGTAAPAVGEEAA